jgi:histidinol dehydrogenase
MDFVVGLAELLIVRPRGRLSAADFVKTIAAQRLDRAGLCRSRSTLRALALPEGLETHAHPVEARFVKT